MKLKINQNVRFKESDAEVLARLPNGFQARLAKEMMPLIRAFDTPCDVAEARAAVGGSIDNFDLRISKLQDLVILVPDDKETVPWPLPLDLLIDEDPTFRDILRQVRGFTMSTPELCYALFQAVEHIRTAEIEGAIVESGVWRGGNVALCALALLAGGDVSRDLYLFDTFDWSWPDLTQWDTKYGEGTAAERNAVLTKRRNAPQEFLDAQGVSEAKVRDFIVGTGYPAEKVHAIKGFVQDTIPENAPDKIALLRLDTDMYESTYHELVHLYPRLVSGGILFVDDYPTERGCVKAVEQYFSEAGPRPFLSRIDTQGRIGVKP
jgi:O-methyltransferase